MDPITRPSYLDVTRVNIVFAAVASGVVGTCFGHPLDLIKVRLQAHSNTGKYKGSLDCLVQTLKSDGVSGLFRGMVPPLFGSTVLNVISFSTYSLINDLQLDYLRRNYWVPSDSVTPPTLSFYNYGLSGLGVGICCAPAVCPIEVVKVRMQLDRRESMGAGKGPENATPRRYNGSLDCFIKILKAEGVRGLYTGFAYTTMRDISYTSTYFLIYEPLKQYLAATFSSMRYTKAKRKEKHQEHRHHHAPATEKAAGFSVLAVVLSGGTSGALAWTVALPFDCVKTLIQKPAPSNDPNPPHHRQAAWDVVRRHYATGGLRSFYSGWIPTILRAFAVSGIRFLVYESTAQWLNKLWKKKIS